MKCEICSWHCGVYEDSGRLGNGALSICAALPPFRRRLLLPLSGTKYYSWAAWTVSSKAATSSDMSPTIYQATRCHIAEDLDQ